MAQSRLEKIGTVYTRAKTLLTNGAISLTEKPLWMDVYEAFPPKYEPRYDRPVLKDTVKPIFYKEDKIRAKFHNDYQQFLHFNLIATEKSRSEIFLSIYDDLEKDGVSEEVLYETAVKKFFELYPISKTINNKTLNVRSSRKINRGKSEESLKSNKSPPEEENIVYKPIRLNLKALFENKETDIVSAKTGDSVIADEKKEDNTDKHAKNNDIEKKID